MKILHFIACIMLPIFVINSGYTMETDDSDHEEQQQQEQKNQQNPNYLKSQVVKFVNGDNMCSLASLNQCLSALNPGNNGILSDFVTNYNNLLRNGKDKYYKPEQILDDILPKIQYKYDYKYRLLEKIKEDITDRYNNLVNLAEEELGEYFANINHYIYLLGNNAELTDITEAKIDNNILNLIIDIPDMKTFNRFNNAGVLFDKNESITVNGKTFDLVSVAFLEVNGSNESREHYVSAKKLPNGKWILIDSVDYDFRGRNSKYIFNSFEELVKERVKKAINTRGLSDTNKIKLLPRLLCYTKRINNDKNSININNNINSFNNNSNNYINYGINNFTNNSYNSNTTYNNYTNNNNTYNSNYINQKHSKYGIEKTDDFGVDSQKKYNANKIICNCDDDGNDCMDTTDNYTNNNNIYNNNYINQEHSKYGISKTDDFGVFDSQKKYNANKIIYNCDDDGNDCGNTTPKFGSLKKSKKDTINNNEDFSIFDNDNFISSIDDITTKISKLNINDNNSEELTNEEINTTENIYDKLIIKAKNNKNIKESNISNFKKFLEQLFDNKDILTVILNQDTDRFYDYCLTYGYGFLLNQEFFQIIYEIALKKI